MKKINETDKAVFFIPNEQEMMAWGGKLAAGCGNGRNIIFLYGELGAGKTTLARGFLRGLGHSGPVKSPTYALVESYELPQVTVFHFDFYRIRDAEELEFIGIHDYFSRTAIFLIEWPEKGGDILPTPDLSCYIQAKDAGREVRLQAHTDHGRQILIGLE